MAAPEFPSILPSGELVCDCELQRTEFALGASIAELLSERECDEAIAGAGGGVVGRAKCGVVALQRIAALGLNQTPESSNAA